MAREHARLLTSIWQDADFRALDAGPQRTYMLLISQSGISWCGVLSLTARRWAAMAADTSRETVLQDIKALEHARFVVVDEDTEEILVRSFLRNDGVAKQPNILRSAVTSAYEVQSPRLRTVLATELRRLVLPDPKSARAKWPDVVQVAAELAPEQPLDPPPNPSRKGSGKGSTNPEKSESENPRSKPLTEGFTEPSREGIAEVPGDGDGVLYPQRGPVGNGVACSRPHGRTRAREAGITHDELAATAHSQSAHQLVHAWNDRHSAGYRTQTLRALTKQVDQLRADRGRDDVIADALDLWHQRTGASPGLLPHLYDDALKTRNGATNGRPSRGDKVRGWLELDENAPIDQQPRGARGDKARAWLDLEVDDEDEDDTRDFAEIVASFGKPRSLPGGAA